MGNGMNNASTRTTLRHNAAPQRCATTLRHTQRCATTLRHTQRCAVKKNTTIN